MNREQLTLAPIDNKNILEDFADEFAIELDDGNNERQTFWKDGCLFLINYKFGSNKGFIQCLYGSPTRDTLHDIKSSIDGLLEGIDDFNRVYCQLVEDGKDIHFAFYWKAK